MSADDRSADGQSADHRPTDAGSFLQRWSRRKQAVQAGVVPTEAAAEGATQIAAIDPQRAAQASPSRNADPSADRSADPGADPSADPGADPSADADTKHTELPSLDSLQGLQSDYLDFMQPKVTQQLKRAALKKLFADPHFNVIDRFEAYSEDYTQADPIPAAMLRGLNQAKGLLFPHDDPKQDASQQDAPKPDEPNQERALQSAVDPLRNAEVEIEAEARPEAQLEARPAAQPLSDGLQKISIKSENYDGGRHES